MLNNENYNTLFPNHALLKTMISKNEKNINSIGAKALCYFKFLLEAFFIKVFLFSNHLKIHLKKPEKKLAFSGCKKHPFHTAGATW